MAPRQQVIRAHFLVVLTAVVLVFGITRFARTLKHQEVKREAARTERVLERFAVEALQGEHEALEAMARAGRGRVRRDAAALLMQVRYALRKSRGRGPMPAGALDAEELEKIKAGFDLLKSGKEVTFERGRSFLRGYYSAVDGTFQPYSVCLPPAYTPERAWPLIVSLHGRQDFDSFQCARAPCYAGAISLKPEGRGATDYMLIGEDDVLAAMDDLMHLYNVDRRRVYLIGSSMGATGAWNLAVHHPDMFAGLVALSGNTDYRVWQERWGWNGEAAGTGSELRRFLHAAASPVSYAENLQNCRIVAAHGTADEVVPVEHARAMARRLRELGYPFEYMEFPGATHGGLPGWFRSFALARVFGHGAAPVPASFRYRTASLRHNRAWWLRLDRLDSPTRFAEVRARTADDKAVITTQNVAALTVLLKELPAPIRAVSVDGVEFTFPPVVDGELSVEKWSGR